MNLPKSVELIEVCPRDGFQNVHDLIPFEGKVAIIKKLAEAGFKRLEIVSFVSPKAIPQMADAKDVVAAVKDTLKEHGVRTVALVPNARGVETAVECGIDELTYVISVSHAHNMANVRRTPEESMEQFKALIEQYGHQIDFRLALATAWAAPSARRSAPSGWRRWCSSAWTWAARRSPSPTPWACPTPSAPMT